MWLAEPLPLLCQPPPPRLAMLTLPLSAPVVCQSREENTQIRPAQLTLGLWISLHISVSAKEIYKYMN